MDTSTLKGLITYLGTPAAVIWIVSNVLDHLQVFIDLDAIVKKAIMVALSILLSLGSALLLGNVSLSTITPDQLYAIIYASVVAFWFADQQHQAFAKRRDAKTLHQIDMARKVAGG